jgi:hypothetical protein
MRGNRGGAVAAFLDKLSDGDPIAIGFVVGFVVVAAVAGLFVWKTARDLKREDDARARKYGRKPPQ